MSAAGQVKWGRDYIKRHYGTAAADSAYSSGIVRSTMTKKWLDASLVPLEKALLARADALEAQAPDPAVHVPSVGMVCLPVWLAAEYRKLAAELHEH